MVAALFKPDRDYFFGAHEGAQTFSWQYKQFLNKRNVAT